MPERPFEIKATDKDGNASRTSVEADSVKSLVRRSRAEGLPYGGHLAQTERKNMVLR